MILYDYFRSTASYRVRIVCHLKNIAYEQREIHLTHQGGEQYTAAYQSINPQQLVPSLAVNGQIITQSMAIIDYLEDLYPETPLLPLNNPQLKATLRSLALMVACDIHPLNNLRVLNQLKKQFKATPNDITQWYHHWLELGFHAFEAQLNTLKRSKPVCCGDGITLADVFLIPQVYNAQRFAFSLTEYPLIRAINDYCMRLPAFYKTAPQH